jgi:AhpD family alkylhydroperoxidase
MQRLNYYKHFPEAFAKLTELEKLIKNCSLERQLIHLVKLRASQINHCAFCVDMHSKEAKIDNEKELRLYHVAVWEESNLFTPRERAALKWTEAVTKLHTQPVSDELFTEVREHFSEKELTELNMVVALINTWNRFAAPFRSEPGSADKAFGLDKAGLSLK